MDIELIHRHLVEKLSYPNNTKITNISSLHGGSINQVVQIELNFKNEPIASQRETVLPKTLVVKKNTGRAVGFFAKEEEGLNALYQVLNNTSISLRVPYPMGVVVGSTKPTTQYLFLEYILPAHTFSPSQSAWRDYGIALATLHQNSFTVLRPKQNSFYGWESNSFIGNNIQYNALSDNWHEFYLHYRLLPQINLARKNGYLATKLEQNLAAVLERAKEWIPTHPQSALLHGDLWTGNFFFSEAGEPVIYDPAVYFGHHEADLAMTELFGSFPKAFYQGYHQILPNDELTPIRKTYYNLYHVINHLNLFGTSYLGMLEYSLQDLIES